MIKLEPARIFDRNRNLRTLYFEHSGIEVILIRRILIEIVSQMDFLNGTYHFGIFGCWSGNNLNWSL